MPKSPDWIAGFRDCLDLVKHRIADADTIEDVIEVLENIEAAVEEKQVEQIMAELFLTHRL